MNFKRFRKKSNKESSLPRKRDKTIPTRRYLLRHSECYILKQIRFYIPADEWRMQKLDRFLPFFLFLSFSFLLRFLLLFRFAAVLEYRADGGTKDLKSTRPCPLVLVSPLLLRRRRVQVCAALAASGHHHAASQGRLSPATGLSLSPSWHVFDSYSEGCMQVHISAVGRDRMTVSYVTEDKRVPSVVEYGRAPGIYSDSATGNSTSYKFFFYRSAKIHYVTIGPLLPSTIYFYRCGRAGAEFSFKTPPAALPVEFAVAGGEIITLITAKKLPLTFE